MTKRNIAYLRLTGIKASYKEHTKTKVNKTHTLRYDNYAILDLCLAERFHNAHMHNSRPD